MYQGVSHVHVLPPIPTAGLTAADVDSVLADVHSKMEALMAACARKNDTLAQRRRLAREFADLRCVTHGPGLMTKSERPEAGKDNRFGAAGTVPWLDSTESECHRGRVKKQLWQPDSRKPPVGLQTEPLLGNEEVVIRLTIGVAYCLRHQHVLLISPRENYVFQKLSTPRSGVHPRCILWRWKAEDGVGQQKAMFRAGSQMGAVIVTAAETMGTQHTLPDSVVCPDTGFEAAKETSLSGLRLAGPGGVQVPVGFVLRLIRAGHWESAGADYDKNL
ncbi:unnamed protein product [Schistocephalus solidus]|uniref:CACTA en-spm transposon protein n=1 Tax=Schistocephalus solidus TaxID=70667 RepID=A0A183SVN2_SCHSO|nr:unnamed protein product [Schistocephalus solidus]